VNQLLWQCLLVLPLLLVLRLLWLLTPRLLQLLLRVQLA
jgi:hypothetical protein